MATFKGDNSTISLVPEDAGWGKPPSAWTGGKFFQNNDGTFNATRGALESEARTPNAELAGMRLGNKQVAGSFPVEVDPKNYNKLFESLMYGRFDGTGQSQALTGVSVSADAAYTVKVPVSSAQQGNLKSNIGDLYSITAVSVAGLKTIEGPAILIAKTNSVMTFMVPGQKQASISGTSTNLTLSREHTLRPAKNRLSFNAEEILTAEDGATKARFMTPGVIVSGVSFDLPSDNTVKATMSMIGSDKIAGKEYKTFQSTLSNSSDAHSSPAAHDKYDPMVLQDGAIVSNNSDVRCRWLSGTIGIENGTEAFFTGCSYGAQGATSGKLRVTVSYEALFQSEDDYTNFQAENNQRLMLVLKDRATEQYLVLYLPSFKASGYTLNNSTGLVTASITGSAIVDADAVNSFIMGYIIT